MKFCSYYECNVNSITKSLDDYVMVVDVTFILLHGGWGMGGASSKDMKVVLSISVGACFMLYVHLLACS